MTENFDERKNSWLEDGEQHSFVDKICHFWKWMALLLSELDFFIEIKFKFCLLKMDR